MVTASDCKHQSAPYLRGRQRGHQAVPSMLHGWETPRDGGGPTVSKRCSTVLLVVAPAAALEVELPVVLVRRVGRRHKVVPSRGAVDAELRGARWWEVQLLIKSQESVCIAWLGWYSIHRRHAQVCYRLVGGQFSAAGVDASCDAVLHTLRWVIYVRATAMAGP